MSTISKWKLLGLCLSGLLITPLALAAPGWVSVTPGEPACTDDSGNRYVNCGNGTVADNQTGLLWLRDASCVRRTSIWEDWDTATIEVANLADGNCGLTDGSQPGDWRLPTRKEWEEMVADAITRGCTGPALTNDAGTGCFSTGVGSSFVNVCSSQEFCSYWSATSSDADHAEAYWLHPWSGDVSGSTAKSSVRSIWPVRYTQ